MALSLNQVSRPKKATPVAQTQTAPPSEDLKKMRPWQTPEDVAPEPIANRPAEAPEMPPLEVKIQRPKGGPHPWLEMVEDIKNRGLSQLPPELQDRLQNTWLGRMQLAPKVRIPIPGIFVKKESDRSF
jgi:hypothetical protein